MPAAAFLEAAAAAAHQCLSDDVNLRGCLQDVAFLSPLLLGSGHSSNEGYSPTAVIKGQ